MPDPVAALGALESWTTEGYAARVHYRGATDAYSIEFYWKVKGDGETAVPVGRDTVPDPLRERIRDDLVQAGLDPEIEYRHL